MLFGEVVASASVNLVNPPAGTTAHVASPLKNLVVSFGALGAKPCLDVLTSFVVMSVVVMLASVTNALMFAPVTLLEVYVPPPALSDIATMSVSAMVAPFAVNSLNFFSAIFYYLSFVNCISPPRGIVNFTPTCNVNTCALRD